MLNKADYCKAMKLLHYFVSNERQFFGNLNLFRLVNICRLFALTCKENAHKQHLSTCIILNLHNIGSASHTSMITHGQKFECGTTIFWEEKEQ